MDAFDFISWDILLGSLTKEEKGKKEKEVEEQKKEKEEKENEEKEVKEKKKEKKRKEKNQQNIKIIKINAEGSKSPDFSFKEMVLESSDLTLNPKNSTLLCSDRNSSCN